MILTSPLEVFGGSEQARIRLAPQAGCSHGDRGNFRLAVYPKEIHQPIPLHPEGCAGGGFWVSLSMGFSWGSYLRGGNRPLKGPLDKDDQPIRVPSEEGKRRQVDRPKDPIPLSGTSGDVSQWMGVPGPIRSP